MTVEKIIMCLPLEFRGSDPVRALLHCWRNGLMRYVMQGLRRNMEMVIEFMIDSDGRGIKRMYARTLGSYHILTYP